MRLEKLNENHRTELFTCGKKPGASEIDDYLKSNALAEQSAGLATVWVAVDFTNDNAIVGFFALTPLSIRISQSVLTSLGLNPTPYPTIGGYLLGRLGVDTKYQGNDFGEMLVAAAIRKAKEAAENVGGVLLAVDPKNERLSEWYENLDFGFEKLDPPKKRLIIRL